MGQPDWLILLPPSEGKAEGGRTATPWKCESGTFARALSGPRQEVADRLAHVRGGDQALLGVKGQLLDRARVANSSVVGGPSLPAWQRYTGVVWDHLDLAGMDTVARSAAAKRILVVSGLAGVVLASDPLPDYRLKMGARLAPFGVMSRWWRDPVTDAIARHVRDRVLVDLLPQEHRAALDTDRLPSLVRVDLVAKSGGVVGGHNAKAAKGLLARHLLGATSGTLRARIATFNHPEYRARIAD